jgi:hypothetical protein
MGTGRCFSRILVSVGTGGVRGVAILGGGATSFWGSDKLLLPNACAAAVLINSSSIRFSGGWAAKWLFKTIPKHGKNIK